MEETQHDFERRQEKLNRARDVGQWVAAEIRGLCLPYPPTREPRRWVYPFTERANGWPGALAIEDGDALLNFDGTATKALLPQDWVAAVVTERGGVLLKDDGTAHWWNPNTGETEPITRGS